MQENRYPDTYEIEFSFIRVKVFLRDNLRFLLELTPTLMAFTGVINAHAQPTAFNRYIKVILRDISRFLKDQTPTLYCRLLGSSMFMDPSKQHARDISKLS